MTDIEVFINRILQNPHMVKSQFLTFFLSCNNMKKFYERKDVEYDDSFFKGLKTTFHKIIDDPVAAIDHKKEQKHQELLAEKNKEVASQPMTEEQKKHVFLEDLTNYIALNLKLQKELQLEFTKLSEGMEEVASRMSKVGTLMEKISSNYKELEKYDVSAISSIKPPNSRLYSDLKTCFFKWNNTFLQNKVELKKLLEQRVGNQIARATTYIEVGSCIN